MATLYTGPVRDFIPGKAHAMRIDGRWFCAKKTPLGSLWQGAGRTPAEAIKNLRPADSSAPHQAGEWITFFDRAVTLPPLREGV